MVPAMFKQQYQRKKGVLIVFAFLDGSSPCLSEYMGLRPHLYLFSLTPFEIIKTRTFKQN